MRLTGGEPKKFFAYPPHLFEKQFKKYMRKVEVAREKSKDDEDNVSYVKLPYIGDYSKSVQNQITSLCLNLCKINYLRSSQRKIRCQVL